MNEPSAALVFGRQKLRAIQAWMMTPCTGEARDPGLPQRQKLGLLAYVTLLVLLRLPQATWQGRFMGEEGPIFFAYAWHRPAWDALWRSFGGYLNLGANASTLLAARLVQGGHLPLSAAPHLTMGIALLFQLLPAVLILWGHGRWLTARWVYLASLMAIVLAPLSEEVWLNVMHIQYHLILCCALILVLETPVSLVGWVGQALILLLAPLCGPGALVLGPLFLARSWLERSLARFVQTAVLGLGGLVQMLVFFTPSPVRGHLMDLPSLASILFVRLGALPMTGIRIGWGIGDLALMTHNRQGLAWWAFAAVSMVYCAFLALTAWRYRAQAAGWLIAAALALALISFGGGMINAHPTDWFSSGAGERYNFLPLALLGIGLAAIAQGTGAGRRTVMLRFCAFVFLVAQISYFSPVGELAHGPAWAEQAALWQQDHAYQPESWLRAWPLDLSDTDRPCPKPAMATASVRDPGYCESAWLGRLKLVIPKN